MFCDVHRLGKKRSGMSKPRPINARFTYCSDRHFVQGQRQGLKETEANIKISKDLPKAVRDIRKKVLRPALKKGLEEEGNKANLIGDRLIINCRRYLPDKIPQRWRERGKIIDNDNNTE